jgi:hypothetical protein
MENAPNLSRDEMEEKYGDNSSEYPPEITELQKELSEQYATHMQWCQEQGLDPKDNEFYLDAETYWNDQREQRHSPFRYVGGIYKGKKIFIKPGTDKNSYEYSWSQEIPVINIEGEQRKEGTIAVHEKAKEIYDKLVPYVAYDKLKIVRANDEITRNDAYVKAQPEREKAERARAEKKEQHEMARRAALEMLGINQELSTEETAKRLSEMTDAIKAIEIPAPYTHSGHEYHRIGKMEAIIHVLNERRTALSAIIGDGLGAPLSVSEKTFPSTNTHRRASQNWSIVGPREWDEWTVAQKMIEASGEVNGVAVTLDATRTYTTTKDRYETPLYSYDDPESVATVAEELASYGRLNKQMKIAIGEGSDTKELTPYTGSSSGWHPSEESNAIFSVLFHLADYTDALTKYVERLKEADARAKEKEEKDKEMKEAKRKQEEEEIKKLGDLF